MVRTKKRIRKIIYLIFDIMSMIVAYFITHFIFGNILNNAIAITTFELISFIMIYSLLVVFMFLVLNVYDRIIEQYGKIRIHVLFKILISIGMAIAIVGAFLFYLKVPMSRSFLLLYTISVLFTTIFNKLFLELFCYSARGTVKYTRNILMVGRSEWGDSYVKEIKRLGYLNYAIFGYVSVRNEKAYDDLDYLGTVEDLVSIVRKCVIDEITISSSIDFDDRLEDILNQCQLMGITINILQGDKRLLVKTHVEMIGDVPVIKMHSVNLDEDQLFAKRILDVTGGCVGMLFFMLAYIILAPIIKLESPGPVIFKQKRVGKNGRIFEMWKFRSMGVDAEAQKAALLDQNEMSGYMFKLSDDPRITKVGSFIRKTSIDELPQFWNVLRGDMSLVGTRPPTVKEVKEYENHHRKRLSINPGITGKWQVSGRSDIYDFEEVVRLDNEYISDWTVWEDVKILFKTVWVVIKGKGSK